jgi:hypothetical protein
MTSSNQNKMIYPPEKMILYFSEKFFHPGLKNYEQGHPQGEPLQKNDLLIDSGLPCPLRLRTPRRIRFMSPNF